MSPELGGPQISALLESVPGIARVLRSPVADALVAAIRAAAGIGEFQYADADELIQYAVRRGLINGDEGSQLLSDVKSSLKKRSPRAAGSRAKKVAKRPPAKKARKPAAKPQRKPVKKAAKRP